MTNAPWLPNIITGAVLGGSILAKMLDTAAMRHLPCPAECPFRTASASSTTNCPGTNLSAMTAPQGDHRRSRFGARHHGGDSDEWWRAGHRQVLRRRDGRRRRAAARAYALDAAEDHITEVAAPMPQGGTMVVVRFMVRCQTGRANQVMAALQDVVAPSRALDGVISFDIGRDVTDPDVFIATEVFEDRAALDRQEALPEVATALGVLEESLASDPEATIFHVSSSAPWGD
jgi:quinol monooxygenase YgiN